MGARLCSWSGKTKDGNLATSSITIDDSGLNQQEPYFVTSWLTWSSSPKRDAYYSDLILKRHVRWLLCTICCLPLLSTETYGDIVVAPSNAAVPQGQSVIMRCVSDVRTRKLIWLTSDKMPSDETEIWTGYDLTDDIKQTAAIDVSLPGQCNLIIIDTPKSAAKRFSCKEPRTLQKKSAELIVIESNPECKFGNGFPSPSITCSVNYTGNWSPIMEWFAFDGKINHTITSAAKTVQVNNSRITSSLPTNTHGTVFCTYFVTTKFSKAGMPQETTAENVPDYSYTNVIDCKDSEATTEKEGYPESKRLIIGLATCCCIVILILFHLAFYTIHLKNVNKAYQRYISKS